MQVNHFKSEFGVKRGFEGIRLTKANATKHLFATAIAVITLLCLRAKLNDCVSHGLGFDTGISSAFSIEAFSIEAFTTACLLLFSSVIMSNNRESG